MDAKSLQSLFYRGNFQDFLDKVSTKLDSNEKVFSLRVGALCFLGKVSKADILFKGHCNSMNLDAQIACRFFLAITWTRLSKHDLARDLLLQNMRLCRCVDLSHESLYFIYQGLAFFRFQQSSLSSALQAVEKSYRYSVLANDLWQQVLALDLKGYIQNASGLRSQALASLEEALSGALKLGNGGIAQTLEVSICCLRAESGRFGVDAAKNLQLMLKKISKSSHFSIVSLNLELARQLSLGGQVSASGKVLSDISELVLGSQHQRFIAQWYLRNAYNESLKGQLEEALKTLAHASRYVDPSVDKALDVSVLGFRVNLLCQLGRPDYGLEGSLIEKTLKSQAGKAKKILYRRGLVDGCEYDRDDPLGDLLDDLSAQDTPRLKIVEAVIKLGYYTLLRNVIGIQPGESCLYFDLIPGLLLSFDQGDIQAFRIGRSSTIRSIFQLLASGPKTKSQLIEYIWGYSYKAYRHDHLIYGLISRFRQTVGGHAWLESSDEGYRLAANFNVYFHQHLDCWPHEAVEQQTIPKKCSMYQIQDLNYRQIMILESLEQERFIATSNVMSHWGVSKITAVRDLKRLEELDLIQRFGRGRATRYSLNRND